MSLGAKRTKRPHTLPRRTRQPPKKFPRRPQTSNVALLRDRDDSREPRQDRRLFQSADIQEERLEEQARADICAGCRGKQVEQGPERCDRDMCSAEGGEEGTSITTRSLEASNTSAPTSPFTIAIDPHADRNSSRPSSHSSSRTTFFSPNPASQPIRITSYASQSNATKRV